MIGEVKTVYYSAGADFSAQLLADWQVTREGFSQAMAAMLLKYDADTLCGLDGLPTSLAFFAPVTLRRGWRDAGEVFIQGVSHHLVKPHRGFSEGKTLDAELKAVRELGRHCATFNHYLIQRFQLNTMIIGADSRSRTGLAIFSTTAWMAAGQVFFKVPYGGEHQEPAPPCPPGFKPLRKSQVIAFTDRLLARNARKPASRSSATITPDTQESHHVAG